MNKSKMLAWMDLETTGLDEHHDPILEVGMILTDRDWPFAELATYQAVVQPDDSQWATRLGDHVTKMHTDNGLLAEVPSGSPIVKVESEMIATLAEAGARKGTVMLAGSGVGHFDRRFIAAQMPTLSRWLTFPSLDVGVLRRAFCFVGREDLSAAGTTYEGDAFDAKPHRALADVADHLAEFRCYANLIREIPWPEEV